MKIYRLLQRVQPHMDTVDLDHIPEKLKSGIKWATEMTGMSTPDYAIRLLVLNAKGVITNDEYVELVFHFSECLYTPDSNKNSQARTTSFA